MTQLLDLSVRQSVLRQQYSFIIYIVEKMENLECGKIPNT